MIVETTRQRISFCRLAAAAAVIVMMSACTSSGSASFPGGANPVYLHEVGYAEQADTPASPFTLKALANTPREVPDLGNQFWTIVQNTFKVNIHAEFVSMDDYETRLRMALASGDIPDAMVLTTIEDNVFSKAVRQGLFWDLKELAGDFRDYPNLKRYIPEKVWKYTAFDNINYIIPRVRPTLDAGLHWRPDLFKEQGLPVPRTLDDYIAGLKQIVDAHPEKGYIGLHFDDSFYNAFGGFDPEFNGENGLVHKYLTDSYTEFVRWYRNVYSMGLMTDEFAVLKNSDKEQMYRSDKALTYIRNIYHNYTYEQDLKKINPEYEAGIIMYLNGPNGHTGEYGIGFNGGFVISSKVPKERALRILHLYNQAVEPSMTDRLLRGFEGVHFHIVNGKRVPTELARKEMSNAVMQVFPNADDEWQKVINSAAPDEWNELMKQSAMTLYEAKEAINPFLVIRSDTWLREWQKVQDDYISVRTQAIMGLIGMDEYEQFIRKLRDMPEFKQAFQEFAESYRLMFQQ
jgi:putative aldouronate transport system substrate-binding protein